MFLVKIKAKLKSTNTQIPCTTPHQHLLSRLLSDAWSSTMLTGWWAMTYLLHACKVCQECTPSCSCSRSLWTGRYFKCKRDIACFFYDSRLITILYYFTYIQLYVPVDGIGQSLWTPDYQSIIWRKTCNHPFGLLSWGVSSEKYYKQNEKIL